MPFHAYYIPQRHIWKIISLESITYNFNSLVIIENLDANKSINNSFNATSVLVENVKTFKSVALIHSSSLVSTVLQSNYVDFIDIILTNRQKYKRAAIA